VTLGGVATFSAQPIFSSLTASSAVATDASKGLVSVTNTGTGNNVLATAPTIASLNLTTALTIASASGTVGQALTSGGSGNAPTWSTIAATPGGSTTQIQYNNAGAFAGSANLVFDGTNLGVNVTPTAVIDVLGSFFNGGSSRTNSNTKTFGFRVPHCFTATNPMNVIGGLSTTSLNYVYIGGSDSNIGGTAATDLFFYTAANNTTANGTERARITSSGYFKASNTGTYLGGTDPYHELRQSDAGNSSVIINCTSGSYTGQAVQLRMARNTTNDTFYVLRYYNEGAAAYKFNVADSGNVTNTNGSYGAISDVKMKTDIVDAGSQWADIKAIRFRKYKMKDDPSDLVQLGVIAQELEQISPGLISEHKDIDGDGVDLGTTTKSVKTSVLFMKSVKALQEAMIRIEEQQAFITQLTARITALEGAA
jgi:hypothetical protein